MEVIKIVLSPFLDRLTINAPSRYNKTIFFYVTQVKLFFFNKQRETIIGTLDTKNNTFFMFFTESKIYIFR